MLDLLNKIESTRSTVERATDMAVKRVVDELAGMPGNSGCGTTCSEKLPDAETKTWWSTHIGPKVPASTYLDHRENESTFLGWYATAWTMVMFAMICDPSHDDPTGRQAEGAHLWQVLTVCFYALAIVLMIAGAVRFFRQQRALMQDKVLVGGIEVVVVCAVVFVALLTAFAMVMRFAILNGEVAV